MGKEKTQHNLKQKAASSMVWTAFQKYSKMGVTFISGIILARLLTPFDYGCIGMLAIFMVLAEQFIDGGFGSALIQKKCPTQEDYSTIFFWNIGMAGLLYAVLFFAAPAISRFYNIPILCDVLRVQGIVLFIYAFNLVQRNQLKKKLNFKILSIISITTSVVALGVTIFMAYKGFGVWALVTQNLITAAIPALFFWFYVKWRPILTFSWKSFKELFAFGFYMFLTHLISSFSLQLQGLLIGKVYNPSTMGYYSKAQGTEMTASHSISSVITQVSYPLYSQAQNDQMAMINMIRRLSMTIAYITMPLMAILIIIAKPLFVLLYSDRWLQSVPYFQVLCLAGAISCLMSVNLQPIAAIGKSKVMFVWSMVKCALRIGLVVGGLLLFGMKGLLIGIVIVNWISYIINSCLVSKYIGYELLSQIKDLLPIIVVATSAAVISYLLGRLIGLGMYLDGAFTMLIFIILYMGWSLVFKPEAYTYTLSIIPSKFRFWEKKTNK